MKRIFLPLSLTFGTILFISCSVIMDCKNGEGSVKNEKRETGTFESISLGISADVTIVQSEKTSVEISANANLLPFISTKVEKNTLIIETKDCNCITSDDPISVTISMPVIRDISLSGSGSITAGGPLVCKDLGLSVSGSGDIVLESVTAENYSIEIAGSGDVRLSGAPCKTGDIDISGSGNVDASGIATSAIAVSIAGSGDASVRPTAALDVSIAGSGDVHYTGSPVIEKSIAGSGEVIGE